MVLCQVLRWIEGARRCRVADWKGEGRWWKVALVSVGNVILGVAIQAGVEALFTEVLHIRSALKVTTTLLTPWGIAKDLVRGLLLEVCHAGSANVRTIALMLSRRSRNTSTAMVFTP
jgi:hypothetical protein